MKKQFKIKKPNKIYKTSDVLRITCGNCGKEFITTNKHQKFCCKECQRESNNKGYDISKEAIFRRDEYRCIYCGASSIEDGVKLHLEHIYPISKGGKEDLFNLATSCERCNTKKNALILPENLILRIWERNNKLNEQFLSKEYDELAKIFKENIRQRLGL